MGRIPDEWKVERNRLPINILHFYFPSIKCKAKLNKAFLLEEEKSFPNFKITYRIPQKTYFADSFYI